MMFKALVTILICDFVLAGIALSLVLRKVPRNVIYGFRIKATLKDDFVWYASNAYFGKLFIISSLVSALLIVFLYFSGWIPESDFLNVGIGVLAFPSLIPVVMTFRYIKSIQQFKEMHDDRNGGRK